MMYEKHFNFSTQTLLDSLPFYALLIDDTHHILMANKVVKEVFGVDLKEIIGQYCPKIIHGIDRPIPECPLEEAVEKGCSIQREVFDSVSKRWVNSAVYPIVQKTEKGHSVFLHLTQDITEKKRHRRRPNKILRNCRMLSMEQSMHLHLWLKKETLIRQGINEELLNLPLE